MSMCTRRSERPMVRIRSTESVGAARPLLGGDFRDPGEGSTPDLPHRVHGNPALFTTVAKIGISDPWSGSPRTFAAFTKVPFESSPSDNSGGVAFKP
jgi:hypothetical protein